MNVSSVTQTAMLYPMNPMSYQVERAGLPPSEEQEMMSGVEAINTQLQVSVQVQDMANNLMQEAADELIASMAVMTGIGQNIDMMA